MKLQRPATMNQPTIEPARWAVQDMRMELSESRDRHCILIAERDNRRIYHCGFCPTSYQQHKYGN